MACYDLHCHSTFSDGLLTPTELVNRASQCGVTCLALTDHDEIAGLPEAHQAAAAISAPFRVINGIECSSLWRHRTIHVVGLGFDPEDTLLTASVAAVHAGRKERAQQIAARLEKLGIPNALAGALRFVTNPDLISRAHFARYLAEIGAVGTKQKAFDRYLGQGKLAYVPPPWLSLETVISNLHAAQGLAVLAHPGRYQLTQTGRRELIQTFKDAGGDAIEILSSSHTPDDVRAFTEYARFFGLAASLGSDFHGDDESRFDLGTLPPLPAGLTPVWSLRPEWFETP